MERIYIFGIGKGKEILKECIFRENVEILGYVDNYADKYINKKVDGLRVIKPEDMGSEFDYIVNSLMQYQGIEGQLLDMGIPKSSIINFFSLEDAQNPEYWKVLKRNEWRIETLSHLYQNKVIPYLSNIKYEVAETFRDGEIKLPTMLPAKKAVEKICLEHVSLARFGDGEFELIQMRNRSRFQTADTEFAGRLKEVLQTENEMVLIAIADNYGSLEKYTESAADAIRQYLTPSVRSEHMELLDLSRTYYDAYLSRPYIMYKDKKGAGERFRILKQIWDGQDILIVEGKNARSGVGNDLFQNTRTIQRILAPDKNAYASYRELYEKVCAYGKDKLILISLGAAATVLAYDLGAAGYWAVDIGQIDMEYEWFLRGVEERCDIPYKNISEMKDGDIIFGLDEEMEQVFKTQIVGLITCEGTKKC